MEIISISLDKETLNEVNRTQKRLGFKSRSRLIKATINSLLNEYKVLENLLGHCDAVFTVTYHHHEAKELIKVMKNFEDIIKTEIHQHHAGTCLRVLITCGEAHALKELFATLKREKGIRSVSCSVL